MIRFPEPTDKITVIDITGRIIKKQLNPVMALDLIDLERGTYFIVTSRSSFLIILDN